MFHGPRTCINLEGGIGDSGVRVTTAPLTTAEAGISICPSFVPSRMDRLPLMSSALMVAALTGSLNVRTIGPLTETTVAPLAGFDDTNDGPAVSAAVPVVNDELNA